MKSVIALAFFVVAMVASTMAHDYYAPPPRIEVVKPTEILEKHVDIIKEKPIVELVQPIQKPVIPVYKASPIAYVAQTYGGYGGYGEGLGGLGLGVPGPVIPNAALLGY